MIAYKKFLYRPAMSTEVTTTEVSLESMLVRSVEEEEAALRSGWSDWRSASTRSQTRCLSENEVSALRRFVQEWKWALQGFVMVAGPIALLLAYMAKN